jgi:hypothetical protein
MGRPRERSRGLPSIGRPVHAPLAIPGVSVIRRSPGTKRTGMFRGHRGSDSGPRAEPEAYAGVLAIRQAQLDPPIFRIGIRCVPRPKRLVLTERGRGEVIGRDTIRDQQFNHRDRALSR